MRLRWALAANAPTALVISACAVACSMPSGGSGGETGIEECDAFLTQYRCYLKSKGMSASEIETTVSGMSGTWKEAGKNSSARPAIVEACKKQLSAKASDFGAAGCAGGAPPQVGGGQTPLQPSAPAPKPARPPALGPKPAATPPATAAPAGCPAGEKSVRDGTGGFACMTPCDPKKVLCGNGPARCSPFGPDQVPVCQ